MKNSNAMLFWGIEVDGKLLVDTGARDLGDTTVSTGSPKQGEGTISDITGNVVTIEPYTDNCFKEGDYLTVNKTLRITPKTKAITGYDQDTKAISLTDPTNLLNFENGDSVYMCDANGDAASFVSVSDSIESISTEDPVDIVATYSTGGGFVDASALFTDAGNIASGTNNPLNMTATFTNMQPTNVVYVRATIGNLANSTGKPMNAVINGTSYSVTSDVSTGTSYWIFDIPDETVITTMQLSMPAVSGNNQIMFGVYLGDPDTTEKLVIGAVSTNRTLTLSGDKDLAYFRKGDVVQFGGTNSSYNQTRVWSTSGSITPGATPIANLFDGSTSTYCLGNFSTMTYTPDTPIPYSTSVELYVYNGNATADQNFFLNGDQVATGAGLTWSSVTTGSGVINSVGVQNTSDGVCRFCGIRVDGKILVDADQVSITAIDDSNPYTITVDGGEWAGTQPQAIQYFDAYGDADADASIARLEAAYNSEAIIKSLPQSFVKNNLGIYSRSGGASYDGVTYPQQDIVDINGVGGTWSFNFLKGELVKPLTDVVFNGAASLYAYTTDFITWTELTKKSVDGFKGYIDVPADAVCTASWRNLGQGVGFDVPLDQRDAAVIITDGDTEVTGPAKSGTGTFDSADATTNTMLLSVSNDMWPDGYYVATAEKDAVSMTAYLDFDANGQNTELTSVPQSGVNMNNINTPQIFFPVEFNTGEAPDTDIPAGSYLQTKVVAKNVIDSADELTSNVLVPTTTTYTAPAAGSVRYTTEEFGEFCRWACSSDYRTAIKTIQDTENTVTEFRDKALNMAQAYIDAQE